MEHLWDVPDRRNLKTHRTAKDLLRMSWWQTPQPPSRGLVASMLVQLSPVLALKPTQYWAISRSAATNDDFHMFSLTRCKCALKYGKQKCLDVSRAYWNPLKVDPLGQLLLSRPPCREGAYFNKPDSLLSFPPE